MAAVSLPSPRAFFVFLFTERLFTTISEPGTLGRDGTDGIDVGLGRDGPLHGSYESRSCLFPLGRPVSRKAGKTKIKQKETWRVTYFTVDHAQQAI